MTPARYIMVGGFLGAGKTTAILRMAEALDRGGRRVGLITNDQSVGLVDTTVLSAHGFPVEEITGGCFCCRFNSLVDAAERLTAGARPDVFIAEPVGSCTDLRASVSYPLRRMYGDAYTVAPLSVVVDPVRALRALGIEPGRSFSPKVLYVYRKQLEEAGLILINKVDAIEPARVAVLREALTREYPKARIFEVSARTGQGMDAWIDVLTRDEGARRRRPRHRLRDVWRGRGAPRLGQLHRPARRRGLRRQRVRARRRGADRRRAERRRHRDRAPEDDPDARRRRSATSPC